MISLALPPPGRFREQQPRSSSRETRRTGLFLDAVSLCTNLMRLLQLEVIIVTALSPCGSLLTKVPQEMAEERKRDSLKKYGKLVSMPHKMIIKHISYYSLILLPSRV